MMNPEKSNTLNVDMKVTALDILDLNWKMLKSPVLPILYEFELPPFSTMTPYRTGSLTDLTSYWKSDDEIIDALTRKLGRKPTDQEKFAECDKIQNFSKRFQQARPYEVYVAQLLWNAELTPFLDSAVDVSQHPKRKELLKPDQADICVAGKLVEVKGFYNLHSRTIKIDGEEYVFMCSAKSYDKQLTQRDYYVLVCRFSLKKDIELRKLGVETHKPLVVPVDRAKLVEHEWTDFERGNETGMFVRKADLISFESFVWELRRHYNKLRKQSNKLDTVEVVRLFYPHLKSLDELMALHPTLTQEQVKQLYAGQDDGSELEWRVAREQEMLELYKERLFDF